MSNANSLKAAQKKFASSKSGDSKSTEKIFELSTTIPDAVYFCSIEPPSISYNLPLERALAQLQREDPSLRVKYDEATMQTVLSGMGELHLEIIKSRILTEYKIDADLGPLQIAYKETIREHARDTFHLKKDIGGSNQEVAFEMSLVNDKSELFNLDKHPDYQSALVAIRPMHLATVRKATRDAMARGPLVGGEVTNAQVILHSLVVSRGIAESFLASATIQCIRKVLKLIQLRIIQLFRIIGTNFFHNDLQLLTKAGCRLLEPFMAIQIITPADRSRGVLGDLARRRAEILDITTREENKVNKTSTAFGGENQFSEISNFPIVPSGDQCKCTVGRTHWVFE